MAVIVTGTIGIDSVHAAASCQRIVGGSAVCFPAAANHVGPTGLVASAGADMASKSARAGAKIAVFPANQAMFGVTEAMFGANNEIGKAKTRRHGGMSAGAGWCLRPANGVSGSTESGRRNTQLTKLAWGLVLAVGLPLPAAGPMMFELRAVPVTAKTPFKRWLRITVEPVVALS